VEEPAWVPGYIYGLNNTGREDISDGRFPRYQRWRLEATEPVTHGSFLIALGPGPGQVKSVEGSIVLPKFGGIQLGYSVLKAIGVECACECLLWDESIGRLTAIGSRSLRHGDSYLAFADPVDMEYSTTSGEGSIYAQGACQPENSSGFGLGSWVEAGSESWRTHNTHRAAFGKTRDRAGKGGGEA
jgi:hypothetical protein